MLANLVRVIVGGVFAAAMFLSAGTAHAGSLLKEGFSFPEAQSTRIVVFRPDVQVGTLRSTGQDEPNVEWTEAARTNIANEMKSQASALGLKLEFLNDFQGTDAELFDSYRALFVAVSSSVRLHGLFGDRLPTKLEPRTPENPSKRWRMDWTLGPGMSRFADLTGADYGLFFYTHDAYGSAGRKTAMIFAAMWGVAVASGVHEGYAALVNLRTGDVVWFNSDIAMGGDPREAVGATKRVGQLLAGFPGSKPALPAPALAPAR
ncbi:hypothetical protein NSE01_23580 [Novosphingobium sediminis]|uniref:DUF4136 domain-containing protein n=1 Tax=Novosphingobium sediminis TaxID=707214 RepID=A0A512ALG8_9SPHN|nr:hypothetical protein [Novosphingobium sediminis]GEO00526.1 hypothetical protein NSE01_23580 [Novosphingobium sediminis]